MSQDSYLERLQTFDDHTGTTRRLGHQCGTPLLQSLYQSYTDVADVLAESDWQEFEEYPPDVPYKDQNGHGSCGGYSCALSVEQTRSTQSLPYIALSGDGIYTNTKIGWDGGSSISTNVNWVETKGCPREADCPKWAIHQFSADAAKNALDYRVTRHVAVQADTAAAMQAIVMTAAQRREPINFSVCVGLGFDSLDSEGCVRLGLGPHNHAVNTFGRARRAKSGRWKVALNNSWGGTWGLGGWAWVYLDQICKGWGFEAYALRGIYLAPSDPKIPTSF